MAKDVIVKQVDVMGLMNALNTTGRAKLSDFATPIETSNETINENSEDENMRLNMNANQSESVNVQNNAQVVNPTTAPIEDAEAVEIKDDVDVAEVDDIKPVVTKRAAANGGPATTMPLGSHGSLVIAGVGSDKPKTTKSGKPSNRFDLEKDKPKVTLRKKTPQVQDSVPQVRLVVYTTKRGEQAPRIDGFGGETDDRWKRHYDEKLRLKEAAKEADKKNEKLKARMKGKSKEERAELLKQWVSVGSDPFNATVRTDFATGNKSYFFLMGAKYMAVAQQLVDAYNSGDEAAIAAAEQAVVDTKNGIVAERQAERDARKAEKPAKAAKNQPSAVSPQTSGEKSYTLDEVAAMLGKLLPDGAAKVDDIKKLLKAA